MIHQAKCKFCGYALELDIADDFTGHTRKPLDWWIAMAACNRCLDYRERLRSITDSILRLCNAWNIITVAGNARDREKAGASTEAALTVETKKLAALLSHHWKSQNTWDAEFVTVLMDNPSKSLTAMRVFIRNTEKAGELFGRQEAQV